MKKKLTGLLPWFSLALLMACNTRQTTIIDSTESLEDKNIALAQSFYPKFENGDWAGIDSILADGFVDHNPMTPPGVSVNKDSLMVYLKATKEGFPDFKIESLHAAATGDLVFIHYRFTGTNTGAMMGYPATGKKVDYSGVDLIRFTDGKAVEHWDYGDNVTYMKQMGIMP